MHAFFKDINNLHSFHLRAWIHSQKQQLHNTTKSITFTLCILKVLKRENLFGSDFEFYTFAKIGSSWVPYTTFRAVPILALNSRRYSYSKNDFPRLLASLILGVGDSPHHRYGESAIEFFLKKTLCIDGTESRRLSAPVIRWVADSP